jgi:hypothetical protein
MKLKEIIENLKQVIEETDLDIDDKTLFEQSCSYQRGQLANYNKNKKAEQKETEKASEQQIKYLKTLKYEGNLNITKKEATQLIKELKEAKCQK